MSYREALAWRLLRNCEGYEPGPADPGLRDWIVQRPRGGHTPVVGAYGGEMLVCEDGLCWPGGFVPYEDIAEIARVPGDLRVVLRDGRILDPPVRPADAPVFRTFLANVRPREAR